MDPSPRLEALYQEHHKLRHDLSVQIQMLHGLIGELRTSIEVFKERDKQERERQTESANWRNEQLSNIRSSVTALEASMKNRFTDIESKMLTKSESWASRVMAIGAIVAALMGIGGFFVAGWKYVLGAGQ